MLKSSDLQPGQTYTAGGESRRISHVGNFEVRYTTATSPKEGPGVPRASIEEFLAWARKPN